MLFIITLFPFISIGTSAFNSTYNHPQYVGWKYTSGNSLATNRGNGTKSTIYSKVETWYNGLSSTDKNYINDVLPLTGGYAAFIVSANVFPVNVTVHVFAAVILQNISEYNYGDTNFDVANYDNSGFINIKRTGYRGVPGTYPVVH